MRICPILRIISHALKLRLYRYVMQGRCLVTRDAMAQSSGFSTTTVDSGSESESIVEQSTDSGPGPSKRKKYNQSFNTAWKGQIPWLSSSHRGKTYGFCVTCNKHLSCSKGGIRDLKRHGETEVHKRNARGSAGQKSLLSTWNETESVSRKAARAEAILCNMLVEHNIPFLLMDHLPAVISHAFPDSKIAREIRCARTKATSVVKHALGPAAHRSMIEEVKSSPAFSIMMDESTDRSDVKRVGMLIRYYSESSLQAKTVFLGLYDIPRASAVNLFECLDSQICKDGLNYHRLIGWNSDGANVMLGSRNSVVSRLKQKQPNLCVLHCICHVSHLIVGDAIKCIPSYVIDIVENLFWWFHHSSKRVDELHSFQEWLEVEAHKILKKVDTRWLSLQACVNRILEQYQPLASYFDSIQVSDEKAKAKAKRIRDHLKKPITKAYLLVLSNILSSINKFNTLFQSDSPNLHKLVKEMNQLLLGIVNKFILPSAVHSATKIKDVNISPENQKNDDDLVLGSALHSYLTEVDDDLAGTSELAQFYSNVRDFLSKLVTSAIKRLPLEDPILNDLIWLDPIERTTSNFSMVRRLTDQFNHCIQREDLDNLEEEFCLYQTTKDLPNDIVCEHCVDIYWGKIGRLKSSGTETFGTLARFAKCLLSIPHGNADSERMFSHISLITTDHRNKLHTSTVSACMDVKMNLNTASDCRSYEPTLDVVMATRKVTPRAGLAPPSEQ